MKRENPRGPGSPTGTGDGDQRLRDLLRLGDPADDGAEPSAAEAAELRRVMLRSARTTTPVRWLPLAAAATAAVAAAVLLLPGGFEPATPPPGRDPAIAGDDETDDDERQIRFATENGTQIIWVLDPDLEL